MSGSNRTGKHKSTAMMMPMKITTTTFSNVQRRHLLDIMEEILLQWNRLLKIDRSQKHVNEAHVYSAFEWEILRNRMFRSILDSMCAAWFSFQVDAFCLAIELPVRMDPKCHLNPLLVILYPMCCMCWMMNDSNVICCSMVTQHKPKGNWTELNGKPRIIRRQENKNKKQ